MLLVFLGQIHQGLTQIYPVALHLIRQKSFHAIKLLLFPQGIINRQTVLFFICREQKIHHLADQMIKIDLDDGVKVNYTKFQDVLAKIK